VRLFLAINLPVDVRREIIAATAGLRDEAPELGWVDEPRLHLTLKFLADQPAERVSEIQATLAGIAARHRELLVTIGGVGAFPNFRRARVVWIGVGNEPRLELLHHDLEIACEGIGFPIDGRPFRPHLTLARIKDPLPEERLRALSRRAKEIDYESNFIAHAVDLMHSELTPQGSQYTTLVSAALRSG
jgi:2'-5' RNA ligase